MNKQRTKEEKKKQHIESYGGNVEKGISAGYVSDEELKEEAARHSMEIDEAEKALAETNKADAIKALQENAEFSIRPSVADFAASMELRLRYFDSTKGELGWLDAHPLILIAKLMEEVGEVADAVLNSRAPGNIKMEATDVGNLAMMIAHKSGNL